MSSHICPLVYSTRHTVLQWDRILLGFGARRVALRACVRAWTCVRACILIGPAFLAGESCLVTCRYLPVLLATAYQDLPGLRKRISSSFIQHYALCNTYKQEVTMWQRNHVAMCDSDPQARLSPRTENWKNEEKEEEEQQQQQQQQPRGQRRRRRQRQNQPMKGQWRDKNKLNTPTRFNASWVSKNKPKPKLWNQECDNTKKNWPNSTSKQSLQ